MLVNLWGFDPATRPILRALSTATTRLLTEPSFIFAAIGRLSVEGYYPAPSMASWRLAPGRVTSTGASRRVPFSSPGTVGDVLVHCLRLATGRSTLPRRSGPSITVARVVVDRDVTFLPVPERVKR